MIKKKEATLIIRVDSKLKRQIIKLAIKDRRSTSDYIRIILEDHIKNNIEEKLNVL